MLTTQYNQSAFPETLLTHAHVISRACHHKKCQSSQSGPDSYQLPIGNEKTCPSIKFFMLNIIFYSIT